MDFVTNNQEMQQYLYEPPFTIKNVHLIIYNDSNDLEEFEPLISIAELDKEELYFIRLTKILTKTRKHVGIL